MIERVSFLSDTHAHTRTRTYVLEAYQIKHGHEKLITEFSIDISQHQQHFTSLITRRE